MYYVFGGKTIFEKDQVSTLEFSKKKIDLHILNVITEQKIIKTHGHILK